MKKLLLLLLLPGCTTTMSDTQIMASQTNQLVSGIAGPNNVSAGLLEFQNYNRNINATLQNPWDGIFTLRNLWLRY
jgi:hypothetical protein